MYIIFVLHIVLLYYNSNKFVYDVLRSIVHFHVYHFKDFHKSFVTIGLTLLAVFCFFFFVIFYIDTVLAVKTYVTKWRIWNQRMCCKICTVNSKNYNWMIYQNVHVNCNNYMVGFMTAELLNTADYLVVNNNFRSY